MAVLGGGGTPFPEVKRSPRDAREHIHQLQPSRRSVARHLCERTEARGLQCARRALVRPLIPAGDEWRKAIEEAILKSRVALLLVSHEFVKSDFILKKEL